MPDNEKLRDIAIKVLNKSTVEKDPVYGFAVVTILMIISIILTCVRILQECNKNDDTKKFTQTEKCALYGDQIKTYSIRKGWFTKMRLKKILRREMGPDDYAKYSISIISALLDTGETLTDDEITTLVEAANV